MSGKKDRDKREKEDRRRRRFWDLAQTVLRPWLVRKFNLSTEDFEPADIDGPVLVAINHGSAYDPLFIGSVFRNKPLAFVASEHLLRVKVWGPLIDRYLSIIPHRKGTTANRTALMAMKRIKRGESLFLAVEGEQTWDGISLPVMPYTGSLIRRSGATLVTYVFEGAYLSAPRWAMSTRRGRVYGHPVNVYSPEMLREMSDEEVEAALEEDLRVDTWEWQKAQPGGPVRFRCAKGGSADGLERSVFSCPECGRLGNLSSDGDTIGCSCGFKIRMSDTGFFEPAEPFETVADWEAFDKAVLAEALAGCADAAEGAEAAGSADVPGSAAGEKVLFADDDVVLHRIEAEHRDKEAARGTLTLKCSGGEFLLTIGSSCFRLKDIKSMTMVLAGRIVFSDETGYYELLSDKKKRTNLRKYVIAREMLDREK